MPAKLERCVKHVQAQGKDKNSAYAICSKSTGWVKSGKHSWKKVEETSIKEASTKIEKLLQENYFNSKEPDYLTKYQRGLYASVTLDPIAVEKIWSYLKKLKLPLMPMNKAHVTIIYSRSRPSKNPQEFDVTGVVEPIGFGIFGKGTKDEPYALVLRLKSQALDKAHFKFRKEYNLKPTYSKYQPHLTLSYDITKIFPGLKKLTPKQKETILNVFDKMLPELPKSLKIQKMTIEPVSPKRR